MLHMEAASTSTLPGYCAVVVANMRRPKKKRSESQTPLTLSPRRVAEPDAAAAEGEAVLSVDADSFDEAVAKHPFLVVQFYAPWCRQSKKLAPEYEKAAQLLSKHEPPIVLAKVDGNDDKNWPLATGYKIDGFPTLRIFRNYGKSVQEYKGPRDAEGIVEYLKKQAGPASKEIKSPEDAAAVLISDKTIYIVGVFAEFSGAEFSNFMEVAEKLRSDYDFAHTLHANHLPCGDVMVERPFVRLFKPFDELVAECKEFDVAALEKFIDTNSTPRVFTLDKSPDNHSHLLKFYEGSATKAMLFLNFSAGTFDSFKSAYYAAAVYYKDKEIKFLIGDTAPSQGALQSFGLKKDQAPLILVRHGDSMFLKDHIEADQIVSWLKEYFDGKLTPFKKSQPIPEVNNEPVKVVVADSLHDVVFKSGKNVLIELYAPWCRDCKMLAPILEEAAITLQSDDEVVVAKMDATANDVPSEFDGCQVYWPAMYLVTASGKVTAYDGGRTVSEIVDFVKKNKETDRATTMPSETQQTHQLPPPSP